MPYEEATRWNRGDKVADFYARQLRESQEMARRRVAYPDVIKNSAMPSENSPHGRLKHLVHEGMDTKLNTLNAYVQELPPGGRSGKHRHMAEEYLFILEGRGYDLHWDPEIELDQAYEWRWSQEPSRHEWEEGDAVLIPPYTIHQHFNNDPERPARFISAMSRLYKAAGYPDLEQLEDAPDYRRAPRDDRS